MTITDAITGRATRGLGVIETAGSIGARLSALLEIARARRGVVPLVWTTIPVPELDPIELYAVARALGEEAVLWLQPAQDRSIVGVGRAWGVEPGGPERFSLAASAWRAVMATALGSGAPDSAAGPTTRPGSAIDRRAAGPSLLGGLGFSGQEPGETDCWAAFGPSSLVLPTFTVSRSDAGTFLTVAVGPDEVDDLDPRRLESEWAALIRRTSARSDSPGESRETPPDRVVTATGSTPDRAAWQRIVGLFAGAVGRGRIDKVVLSRRVSYRANADFDLVAALRHLARTAAESTTFAFGRSGVTFLGATPERLVRTEGRSFETVAIAGSAARGRDATEDARFAAALLASEKDREEQAVVVETLRANLGPIVDELHVADTPGILPLKHVQHLVTPITGTLRAEQGLLALAERLHPTPAVGGAPRGAALEMITEHEHADRGWYAGPIGWLGADGDGELMVALRCALVAGAEATLFAGCGIVADSDPAGEWEESRLKLRAMGLALGVAMEDV